MDLAFSCFSKLSSIRPVWCFSSLVYSLKWLSSEVHLPILLISRREYRSMTVCAMNLAKIYRNVADKFDMSPEDAEKKSRTFAFFSQWSQQSYGNRLIVEILGIARIAKPIFQQFWWSQRTQWLYEDYDLMWKPGLKNSGENECGLDTKCFLSSCYLVTKKSSF